MTGRKDGVEVGMRGRKEERGIEGKRHGGKGCRKGGRNEGKEDGREEDKGWWGGMARVRKGRMMARETRASTGMQEMQ